MSFTFEALAAALRASWDRDTCAPEDIPDWSEANPARGQCGTTALVVHDHLGGRLVLGEVHRNGARVDYHWWNQLPDGAQVDLTRSQFSADESVVGGEPIDRPVRVGRLRAEYSTLRARVADHLGT